MLILTTPTPTLPPELLSSTSVWWGELFFFLFWDIPEPSFNSTLSSLPLHHFPFCMTPLVRAMLGRSRFGQPQQRLMLPGRIISG